jgi:3'-phosphoadenosine 5'-phosphosulfate sulfotransferase (PAPS reductase)/FAD synthetase
MTPTSLSDAVQDQSRRHIIPLSGGKDSTALAVYMLERHSDLPLEFVFTDTGAELPETYSYLRRFEAIFGVEINRLTALDLPELQVRSKGGRRSPFDVLLNEVYSGFLPNPQARWCTRMLKIKPFEHFVGGDDAYSYIGIRADENREGFRGAAAGPSPEDGEEQAETGRAKPVVLSNRNNILPVYPLKDIGFGLDDVRDLLLGSGLGLPPYYDWRSRSGWPWGRSASPTQPMAISSRGSVPRPRAWAASAWRSPRIPMPPAPTRPGSPGWRPVSTPPLPGFGPSARTRPGSRSFCPTAASRRPILGIGKACR